MNVVVVVNAVDKLNPATDTSVGLMHAAQNRGATVWVTTPESLSVRDGRPWAAAHRVELAHSEPAGGCSWTVPAQWIRLEPAEQFPLDDAAAVLMWVEPPVTESFLTATFVLDLVRHAVVLNSPQGLRACSEHLLPLHFPELIPPTLVTADPAALTEFVADHGVAVLKPVDGFSGHGVFRLAHDDPNLPSLLSTATQDGVCTVIVQEYLPAVADGNKRLFVFDGVCVGAVYRYPESGDFRIGQPSAPAPITARDLQICDRLAPTLGRHGLRVAGLDVIGPHLIEVNVTSPGALRKADALLGWELCDLVLDMAVDAEPGERMPA